MSACSASESRTTRVMNESLERRTKDGTVAGSFHGETANGETARARDMNATRGTRHGDSGTRMMHAGLPHGGAVPCTFTPLADGLLRRWEADTSEGPSRAMHLHPPR